VSTLNLRSPWSLRSLILPCLLKSTTSKKAHHNVRLEMYAHEKRDDIHDFQEPSSLFAVLGSEPAQMRLVVNMGLIGTQKQLFWSPSFTVRLWSSNSYSVSRSGCSSFFFAYEHAHTLSYLESPSRAMLRDDHPKVYISISHNVFSSVTRSLARRFPSAVPREGNPHRGGDRAERR
jgi:hypothetical protein